MHHVKPDFYDLAFVVFSAVMFCILEFLCVLTIITSFWVPILFIVTTVAVVGVQIFLWIMLKEVWKVFKEWLWWRS